MLPSLYISHGSPNLVLSDNQTTQFLKSLSSKFEKPKYIVIISAHWVTKDLHILYNPNPSLIYDFYGFSSELYSVKCDLKTDLKIADKIVGSFEKYNIKIIKDETRDGFDHGVWTILKLLYPNADIPVIQLSLPYSFSEKELIKMGEVLQEIKNDGLLIASGAMTHNLRDVIFDENTTVIKSYAKVFRDFVVDNLELGNWENLQNTPYYNENHPTKEHFLPLYIALGASNTKIGISLNNTYMYGNQSMDSILFKD